MTVIVSEKFFPAFGVMVHSYATVEMGIKYCAAALLRTEVHCALIVFSPYTAMNLANVTKTLADEVLKPEIATKLKGLVSRWQAHTDLRTYIAHHRWRIGDRPDSIRPTFWDVRSGSLRVKGFDSKEPDYIVEDIRSAAAELARLNEEIKAFLESTGLEKIIAPKTDDTNAASA